MAKCTPVRNEVKFTLELTEAEAWYVRWALYDTFPKKDSLGPDYDDPVYGELVDALEAVDSVRRERSEVIK